MTMRALLLSAALAFLCGGAAAHAQADCLDRYQRAYDLSIQAYWNAPDRQKKPLGIVQFSLLTVLGYLSLEPEALPADVCGETLRRVEAQAMVWHEKGWTPTRAERDAAEKAAALKSLQDALAALEAK